VPVAFTPAGRSGDFPLPAWQWLFDKAKASGKPELVDFVFQKAVRTRRTEGNGPGETVGPFYLPIRVQVLAAAWVVALPRILGTPRAQVARA